MIDGASEGEVMDDMRYAQREGDSLDASLREADEILDTGAGVLGNLSDQRQMLKNMRKKMLGERLPRAPSRPPPLLPPAADLLMIAFLLFVPWQM